MKIKGDNTENCVAKVRNLPNDLPLMLRIEYHKPEVYVLIYDHEKEDYE